MAINQNGIQPPPINQMQYQMGLNSQNLPVGLTPSTFESMDEHAKLQRGLYKKQPYNLNQSDKQNMLFKEAENKKHLEQEQNQDFIHLAAN